MWQVFYCFLEVHLQSLKTLIALQNNETWVSMGILFFKMPCIHFFKFFFSWYQVSWKSFSQKNSLIFTVSNTFRVRDWSTKARHHKHAGLANKIRCCTSTYCVHTLNTKTICSNLNGLNTFTKETSSPTWCKTGSNKVKLPKVGSNVIVQRGRAQ
jgi:hypothetical protein